MNKFAFKNGLREAAPILLGIGASVGVVLTGIQVAKDTPKAMAKLEEAQSAADHPLTFLEKVKVMTPAYLPSILTGITTVTCIISGTMISQKGKANMAVLAAGATEAYNKVSAKLDPPVEMPEPLSTERNTEGLYYLPFYGYFSATRETVLNGFLKLNEDLAENGGAMVYDFLRYVGIDPKDPQAKACQNLGWDANYLYDEKEKIYIKGILSEGDAIEPGKDGEKYIEISWEVSPIINPWIYDPFDGDHKYGTYILEEPYDEGVQPV